LLLDIVNHTCDDSILVTKAPLDVGGGLQTAVKLLRPDTVVINSGLWTNLTSARARQLARLLEPYRADMTFIWKTTTANKLPVEILDEGPLEVLPAYGWKIFDAYRWWSFSVSLFSIYYNLTLVSPLPTLSNTGSRSR
jgi:hypothetical protein